MNLQEAFKDWIVPVSFGIAIVLWLYIIWEEK